MLLKLGFQNQIAKQIVENQITPEGAFDEKLGVWIPSPNERRPCCARAERKISRRNPYVVFNHCKTIEHLSLKYEIPYKDLKAAVRQAREDKKYLSEKSQ